MTSRPHRSLSIAAETCDDVIVPHDEDAQGRPAVQFGSDVIYYLPDYLRGAVFVVVRCFNGLRS